MIRTRTYTAKLTPVTHRSLDNFLLDLARLYNVFLGDHLDLYRIYGVPTNTGYADYNVLTGMRRHTPALAEYDTAAQRSVLDRLHRSFKRHKAKKGGRPRFKSEQRKVRSFETTPKTIHTQGRWNYITIKGLGKIRFQGQPSGTVKTVRIVRTPRRVVVQFICEIEDLPRLDMRPSIGIDVGIKNRVALSDGHKEHGIKLDRKELKRRQRRVSKSVKGSNNRRKKVAAVSKEWQRVRDRERGQCHELTTRIVREHGSRIFVEDLQIPNMVKNHSLARAIHEQTWGRLVHQLTYKAASAGGVVVSVNPRNTSQQCSGCGSLPVRKLDLSVRRYRCPCGIDLDRDVNAACNIRLRGLDKVADSGGWPEVLGIPERMAARAQNSISQEI